MACPDSANPSGRSMSRRRFVTLLGAAPVALAWHASTRAAAPTFAAQSLGAGASADAVATRFRNGRAITAPERAFGPNAPWNRRVVGLARHPESDQLRDLLWNNAPAPRPGNFNITTNGYTYPVFDARSATGLYPVTVTGGGSSNLIGTMLPWNPTWQPAAGTDGQVIILDPSNGREWDLWKVSFNGGVVTIANGNLVPGSYWTKEDSYFPSRGCGIQYLAMLVRPTEVAAGTIEHALSMPIRNPSGQFFVAPATKLDHPEFGPGVPMGTRFALDVTDADIQAWASSLPAALPAATRTAGMIIARALRDYGWFITDTAGGATFQFEDRASAGSQWDELGLGTYSDSGATYGYKVYPDDLLDGLLQRERIHAIVPSDNY